mmetsp:Transcript_122890/g.199840  ORF Transcript_122890/g.199840 Transcript_122890/m.199840 type:complete len:402 (+) Transcript_122890:810-2015(+)
MALLPPGAKKDESALFNLTAEAQAMRDWQSQAKQHVWTFTLGIARDDDSVFLPCEQGLAFRALRGRRPSATAAVQLSARLEIRTLINVDSAVVHLRCESELHKHAIAWVRRFLTVGMLFEHRHSSTVATSEEPAAAAIIIRSHGASLENQKATGNCFHGHQLLLEAIMVTAIVVAAGCRIALTKFSPTNGDRCQLFALSLHVHKSGADGDYISSQSVDSHAHRSAAAGVRVAAADVVHKSLELLIMARLIRLQQHMLTQIRSSFLGPASSRHYFLSVASVGTLGRSSKGSSITINRPSVWAHALPCIAVDNGIKCSVEVHDDAVAIEPSNPIVDSHPEVACHQTKLCMLHVNILPRHGVLHVHVQRVAMPLGIDFAVFRGQSPEHQWVVPWIRTDRDNGNA